LKDSFKVALSVIGQSTPYVIAALIASVHPAAAAPTGGIAEVHTGAALVQNTFLGAGLLFATVGIGSGAVHLAHHREDLAGGAGRVGAGVIGATIIGKAPALATMFAPVTF
jgi:hypothetical protein